jgi:protein neuralized
LTCLKLSGPNISLNGTGLIAWRHEDEYSNGYVFTGEPLRAGERIVVQILATENMYIGSLAFGLTSCDPAMLDPERLPEDSDMLLDRSEYWVVSKVGVSASATFQIRTVPVY